MGVMPALVELGPIEVGTLRSLSQSDKHNKASPTTTYSFFPLIPVYAFYPWGSGHEKDSKAK